MIQAIPTTYNGVQFRSRTEAKVAVLLDLLQIRWQYELEGYQLSSGDWYLPDFWLPGLDCFWEVKGSEPNEIDQRKIETLVKDSKKSCILSTGNSIRDFTTVEYREDPYFNNLRDPDLKVYISGQPFLFDNYNKKIYLDVEYSYYYNEALKDPYEAINSNCLECTELGADLPITWQGVINFLFQHFHNTVNVMDYLEYAQSSGKIYLDSVSSLAIDPRRYKRIREILPQAMNYKFH